VRRGCLFVCLFGGGEGGAYLFWGALVGVWCFVLDKKSPPMRQTFVKPYPFLQGPLSPRSLVLCYKMCRSDPKACRVLDRGYWREIDARILCIFRAHLCNPFPSSPCRSSLPLADPMWRVSE
jgi:hypothetical protein